MSRLILVFIFIFHKAFSSSCPLNGVSSLNGENKCYYFFSIGGDFMKAERTCQEQGGHLVSICNAFDNNFLMDIASQRFQPYGEKDFWIGYNDLSGAWNWTNPNASCSYTNGNFGPPGGNDCAAFSISSGKWVPNDCSVSKPFVCEIQSSKKSPQCLNGYTYYREWNSCYKFVNTELNFTAAENYCQNEGGHLTSVHSIDEDEFLDTLFHQNRSSYGVVFIGFYDYSTNLSSQFWSWTDGSPVTYANWISTYPPQDDVSSCAHLVTSQSSYNNGSRFWRNYWSCSTPMVFFCKQNPICS